MESYKFLQAAETSKVLKMRFSSVFVVDKAKTPELYEATLNDEYKLPFGVMIVLKDGEEIQSAVGDGESVFSASITVGGEGEIDGVTQGELDERAPLLPNGHLLFGTGSGNVTALPTPNNLGMNPNGNTGSNRVPRFDNGQFVGSYLSSINVINFSLLQRTATGQGKFAPAVNPDEAVVLSQLDSSLESKVDKSEGKGLSPEEFTTAEKNKLAGLEDVHYKGWFTSLASLEAAHPAPEEGAHALVDDPSGSLVYIWKTDVEPPLWEARVGEGTEMTAAQVKTYYESNPDTNVLTDAEKQALNNMLSDDRFTLKRLGTWNASTNTPQLLQGEGTRGDYRVVTTPGSYDFGNGLIKFNQGDWVIFTGGIWHKIVTTDSIVNWNDVQNKPNLPASPRGNISAGIPALRKGLNSAQSIPVNTNTRISSWGAGYDQFSLEATNGIFVMPEWASHARVTCSALLDSLQAGKFFHLEVRLNTASTAEAVCGGIGNLKKPSVLIDTGIIPISPGDEFSAVVWHNADTAKQLEAGARTMINIELFETI